MKPLAPNNRLFALVPPGLLLIVVTIIVFTVKYEDAESDQLFLLLGLYALLGLWVYSSYRTRNIFFDNEQIYLIGNKSTLKIPIEDLRRLKLTLSGMKLAGFQLWQYKIEYAKEDGDLGYVNFWTGEKNDRIENFETHIKRVNPNIKVEHWAHSFE